jgi:hypothetical protein
VEAGAIMVKVNIFRLLAYFLFISVTGLYSWPKKMIVTVPVADLRADKSDVDDLSHSKPDMKQLSQLLFGEQIIAKEEKDGYLHISAIGQQVYNKEMDCFIGCPGWIKAGQAIEVKDFYDYDFVVKGQSVLVADKSEEEKFLKILLGTRFCKKLLEDRGYKNIEIDSLKNILCYENLDLDEESLRKAIVETAKLFLDGPYTWGGRSIYDKDLEDQGQLTGADCSNLVALCYKVYGIDIPRNTRSQHKKCKKIELGSDLKPGDLVFIARKKLLFFKIGHVMLYIGNDEFIEAVGGDIRKVVKIKGADRFGKPVSQLKDGDITDYGKVYFGSFLNKE